MKKTKLANALLIGSLITGGAASATYAVNDTVAKAADTQAENQSNTTEIQTNSQTITRTIKYDLSDVQQYLKPGVEYPKDQTQSVTIMQQGVKGSGGNVDYGDWSVGTFSSISLAKLQGANSNIELVPVNESGTEVSEVPQQNVKHGDQNTTITIKYKAIDTSKNDANQNNTAADQNSIAANPDPEPEQPKGQTPEISDSSSESSDNTNQNSSSDDTQPSQTDSSKKDEQSSDTQSSDSQSSNNSKQASTDQATNNQSNTTDQKSDNQLSDTQASSNNNNNQKSDDQTSNGLPVQNNGTSQTTSKTEAQPNTGNLPQTGDQSNHKGITAALESLLMFASAGLIKLKSLF